VELTFEDIASAAGVLERKDQTAVRAKEDDTSPDFSEETPQQRVGAGAAVGH